ncbi:MAG: signal peptidase I [Acidimicrobiales bacterium]
MSSPASHEPPAAGDIRAGAPAQPAPAPPRRRRSRRVLVEWVVILGIAVLAAFLVRTFVVEPFFIPSGSMEPTLQVNDRILVNKLSYDLHAVHRGDIVVFHKLPSDVSPGITDLVKRVIGLPNETISAHDGSIYIDGHKLAEPWLPKGVTTAPFGPVHIPKGDYFMMGDNRGDSSDSRVFGPVPGKLFVGRAFVRVWPLSRIGGL